MIQKLNNIRQPLYDISFRKKTVNTLLVLLFGLLMGIFSKFLDCIPSNRLPFLLETLDLGNFFSRMSIWYFISVVLSIYSRTPIRAAINVFMFFFGMLVGYYVYTRIFAGFYPDRAYLMIWIVLTIISPVLACVCWYAKGRGKAALVISSFIIAVLFLQAFSFGLTYFDVLYQGLEIIVWIAMIVLLYKSPKQCAAMIILSLILAVVLRIIFPFVFLV